MLHIHLTTVDSTNNFVHNFHPEQEEDITLVTADFQTAGRGQRGNSWESEEGKNVVYSLLVHPRNTRPSQMFYISEVAALSVCEALEEVLGEECTVKWPNDIYHGNRKIAGILIETDIMGGRIENAIIGVGVNVNQREFRSDAPNPVSVYQLCGHETERERVMKLIMERFGLLYSQLERGEFAELHTRYKAHLFRRDGMYRYKDEEGYFEARIVDIEPTGHLLLEDAGGGMRRYAFKEVSFVI